MAAQELQSALSFVGIKITVKGKEIQFSGLSVHEYLADTGSFSFNWRQPFDSEKKVSIDTHIDFYKDNLGAEVNITIGSTFTFNGIIFSINCTNQEEMGLEYEISGKGLAVKLDNVSATVSFLKKPIKDIVESTIKKSGLTHKVNAEYSDKLYYTVQYNQSNLAFLRMLAARYGEWFFYDGKGLQWGKPDNNEIELIINSSVYDWQISAKMTKTKSEVVSTDLYTGLEIKMKEEINGLKGMYDTVSKAADKTIEGLIKKHLPKNVEEKLLKKLLEIQLKGELANAVFVSGSSYAVNLRLCSVINVKSSDKTDQGKYRVTEVHHRSNDGTDYYNNFTAIPLDAERPPYTNTEIYPVAMAQPAEVVDNEDKDGLDRIKVKFPWQAKGETTPKISMLQTHAGKNKGFRFLPEVGDKVMVGFLDDNAERPYVLGALYNENEKSGVESRKIEKNQQKFIGTQTGRRLVWDEKEEIFSLDDNAFGFPANKLIFSRKKREESIKIQSGIDQSNGSIIEMNNEKNLEIGMLKEGKLVAKIIFDSKDEKITIESEKLIEIKSKNKITMGAPEITITGQKKVTVESQGELELKGVNVKIEAQAQLQAKGAIAVFEGSGKADFKGGGMASLTGGIVKIN